MFTSKPIACQDGCMLSPWILKTGFNKQTVITREKGLQLFTDMKLSCTHFGLEFCPTARYGFPMLRQQAKITILMWCIENSKSLGWTWSKFPKTCHWRLNPFPNSQTAATFLCEWHAMVISNLPILESSEALTTCCKVFSVWRLCVLTKMHRSGSAATEYVIFIYNVHQTRNLVDHKRGFRHSRKGRKQRYHPAIRGTIKSITNMQVINWGNAGIWVWWQLRVRRFWRRLHLRIFWAISHLNHAINRFLVRVEFTAPDHSEHAQNLCIQTCETLSSSIGHSSCWHPSDDLATFVLHGWTPIWHCDQPKSVKSFCMSVSQPSQGKTLLSPLPKTHAAKSWLLKRSSAHSTSKLVSRSS